MRGPLGAPSPLLLLLLLFLVLLLPPQNDSTSRLLCAAAAAQNTAAAAAQNAAAAAAQEAAAAAARNEAGTRRRQLTCCPAGRHPSAFRLITFSPAAAAAAAATATAPTAAAAAAAAAVGAGAPTAAAAATAAAKAAARAARASAVKAFCNATGRLCSTTESSSNRSSSKSSSKTSSNKTSSNKSSSSSSNNTASSSSSNNNTASSSSRKEWALRTTKQFDALLQPLEQAALQAAARRSSSSSSSSSGGCCVTVEGLKHLKGFADAATLQRFASDLLDWLGLKRYHLAIQLVSEKEMHRLRDAYPSSSSSKSSSSSNTPVSTSSSCSSSISNLSNSSRSVTTDALSFAAADPQQFALRRELLLKAAVAATAAAATETPATATATAAAAAAAAAREAAAAAEGADRQTSAKRLIGPRRRLQRTFLGDIFLCPSVVYRQQQEDRMQQELAALQDGEGEPLPQKGVLRRLLLSGQTEERLQLLLVHSILHLLGFTHSTRTDLEKMREVEEFLLLLRPPRQHGLYVVGVGVDIVSADRFGRTLHRLLAADAAAAEAAAAAGAAAAAKPAAAAVGLGCTCSAMCRYTARLLSPLEAAEFRRLQRPLFGIHWASKQQPCSSTAAAAAAAGTTGSAAVGRAARLLSRRFAAKEAAAKALGVGLRILNPRGVSLNEIEVRHSETGRPLLLLRGAAEALRVSLQVRCLLLSVSDDGGLALAQVIACS
ncbi:hypothetical protein Efla_000686 [Eimeria flavescens]